jgi:N-acetylmuramoyl-L-alanine amidase
MRTSGQIPQVTLRRSPDRRSITVEMRDTALAQTRIPTPSLAENNRLGIRQLSVTQASSSPAVARLTLQVPAEGPDWQATASNLGGIVLLPLGSPVATQPTPPTPSTPPASFPPASFPSQPGIAIVQGISLDRGSRQILVRLDQGVRASVRYQGGESLVLLSPARLAPGVTAPRVGRGDPLEGIDVRQVDGEVVMLTLRPGAGLSVGAPQALNSQLLSVPLLRGGGSILVTPNPTPLPPFPSPNPTNPLPPRPFPTSPGGRPIQTVPPPNNPFPDPNSNPGFPPAPSGRRVVTIDPGHGGPDPGAIGIGGLKETDVVLDMSKQIAALLESNGVQVVLTRDAEYDVDLEPRVQIAERANSTVFVSIHANAISMARPDINGLETFYYSSGEQLANVVHQSILETVPVRDRGVRQARFYVIRRTTMPAILVETGYLTGAEDARNLATSSHRRKLAEAIVRGILRYIR